MRIDCFPYFRHAAIAERRVRSDQRKSENTQSTNRQSQLESEYVSEFKDGARVDAVEVITKRASRFETKPSVSDYLKFCRLACFIFEVRVLWYTNELVYHCFRFDSLIGFLKFGGKIKPYNLHATTLQESSL